MILINSDNEDEEVSNERKYLFLNAKLSFIVFFIMSFEVIFFKIDNQDFVSLEFSLELFFDEGNYS